MEQQISFIHCADIHLDSPFKGLSHLSNQITDQVRESTFQAFNSMIQLAIDKQVDFVLIVGDLFDQEEQSMKAHMTVVKGFQLLKDHNIQVFLSFGNHDFIKSQTFPRNYPDNVFVFENEQVEVFPFIKNDQALANIYGFSYYQRAVENNMVPHYKMQADALFHIACLHGSLGNGNTEHANYAPFQLNEMRKLAFDYWALGHIHKREILSDKPAIVYPGNIQGRSIKEAEEKGCYHVILSESASELEFCRLDQIQFEKISLNVSDVTDITEVNHEVEKTIETILEARDKVLLELTFLNATDQFLKWDKEGKLAEMMELWNQQYSQQTNWVQVIKMKLLKTKTINEWREGEQFLQQLEATFDKTSDLDEILEPLWHHTEGRQWLDTLSKEVQEELLVRAKEEAIYLLHEREESE